MAKRCQRERWQATDLAGGRGVGVRAKTHADTVIWLAAKYHLPYWEGWGRILSGWSLGHIGRGEDGLSELNCGIDIYRSTGAEQMLRYAFSLRRELLKKAATESCVVWFPSHAEDERTDSESLFYKGKADPGSPSPVRDLGAQHLLEMSDMLYNIL